MRVMGAIALTLAAAAMVPTRASAQAFRGGPSGGGYLMVANRSVQQELKLSGPQAEKATKVVEEAFARANEKVRDLPRTDRREKARPIYRAANKEIRASLKDILEPEQLARLEQIVLQHQGIRAFDEPSVQARLRLSDDQKRTLKEISDSLDERRRQAFREHADDREATVQAMRALNKESMEKALKVLTEDQTKTWKETTGEPFEPRPRRERRPSS